MVSPASTTRERALRALRCSVLTDPALAYMERHSIPLADFVGAQGVTLGYTRRSVGELAAEDDLMWLIRVGVLRREVDGQGITDRFRLTPMGQSLIRNLDRTPEYLWESGLDWLMRRLPY